MALTSDACHKGLPKSATGEIPQFKGENHPSSCEGVTFVGGGGDGQAEGKEEERENLERVPVLVPVASLTGMNSSGRLAQAVVVRHRVEAPLQASQRLVPSHQRRKQRHGLHRGELAGFVLVAGLLLADVVPVASATTGLLLDSFVQQPLFLSVCARNRIHLFQHQFVK